MTRLTPIRRATELAAEALKKCEAEGIAPANILAGFAVALQRLTLQAAAIHNPDATARVAQIVQGFSEIVRAARGR